MRLIASNVRVQFDENRKPEIVLSVADLPEPLNALKQAVLDGKKLAVEISQHRQKRSLDANAYLWVMLAKMADVLRANKDDLYLTMLERYGQFTHVVVRPDAVDKFTQQWRVVRNLGGIKVNGVYGVQLQCYFGSSTYDTKEMATLIDGVVQECKDLGIETLPHGEIERMSQDWGR